MRVALLITRADIIAGASHLVADIATGLQGRGHQICVFVGGTGPYLALLTSREIPYRVVPHLQRAIHPVHDLSSLREVRRALADWQPDLVASHTAKAGVVGRVVAWRLGVASVYSPHCWGFDVHITPRDAVIARIAERALSRLPGSILVTSEDEVRLGLDNGVGSPEQYDLVHNGVRDVPVDRIATPDNDVPLVLMVARFEEQKDQPTLLRALARLPALPWRAEFVGDGPLRPDVERLAAELGLADRVAFVGAQSDVDVRMGRSDVFVLTTHAEGFPVTVLEAMRSGLPVIATDVGGTRESVDHERTGLLVHHGDVADVAAALERLLTDSVLRATMGAHARAAYLERFTVDHMVEGVERVYQRMADARARTPRRIVLVTNGLTNAGAETQTVRLAEALRTRGDEVGLLSILPTRAFHGTIERLGIPVAHVFGSGEPKLPGPLLSIAALAKGTAVLRRWRPDAVIGFVYQSNVLARIAGRAAGVPVILTSVRTEVFGGPRRDLVMRLTDRLGTVTTTNSALAARALIERRVVPAARIMVIPNALAEFGTFRRPEGTRSRVRAELGVGDRFLWLAAGRLEPQKDYDTLLAACEPLGPGEVAVRVAGQGPLLEQLRARAGANPADIQFLGLRTDVPDLLAAADGLVLSSAWEGLPNIVMEAMASGLPVVATSVGGVPELVADGVTGFLVPPLDPDALGAAMAWLQDLDAGTRTAMGEEGRRRVRALCEADVVHQQWFDLLDGHRASNGGRRRKPLSL